MTASAYADLVAHWQRLYHLDHLLAMARWDRAALMPPKGNAARAAAMAELSAISHTLRCDARLSALFAAAEEESLEPLQRANLREMWRDWQGATALPESLVEARTVARAICEHGWRTQRPANDWQGFLQPFREVLRLAREEARLLADATGLAPYDALLDRYEPGMTAGQLDPLFADLQQWLPGLIAKARARQAGMPLIRPQGPFPKAAQRALNLDVMALLGFDFAGGRLDESAHPFNGGVPEDTRMTTRYREEDCIVSLMATIHETGHARYEQNLPRALLGKSSIQYVNEEDKAKPKSQSYKVYADLPIALRDHP